MKPAILRIILFTTLIVSLITSSACSAAEQRTALVIGNSTYSSGPLKNPVNDAADMAAMLKKLGFAVTLKQNARQQEMDEAIEDFGNRLKRGGVGLFYYAGHGLQVNGTNYLIPIGAKIGKEADVKYQAVDANRILDEMANANNGLNIVMLDACRDNPFSRSFRNASRGLAIVSSAPSGTFISYSTSPGNVARDGDGRNSPYTAALLQYMQAPGLSISDMFINVRTKIKKETGQVPWELSSLEGQFYFKPGSTEKAKVGRKSSSESITVAADALDDETRKLEDEERTLEREKSLLERKKALEVERQKIVEEKAALEGKTTPLAVGTRPAVTGSKEIKRDGRFIAYNNGTVLDTKTNLMWASKDNGSDIDWLNAKSYCENYRGGGYSDWRMPTQDELAGLYDTGKSRPGACNTRVSVPIHVATELIDITCFDPWASETRGSEAAFFGFGTGNRVWDLQSYYGFFRALPVRSAK